MKTTNFRRILCAILVSNFLWTSAFTQVGKIFIFIPPPIVKTNLGVEVKPIVIFQDLSGKTFSPLKLTTIVNGRITNKTLTPGLTINSPVLQPLLPKPTLPGISYPAVSTELECESLPGLGSLQKSTSFSNIPSAQTSIPKLFTFKRKIQPVRKR